MKSEEKNIQEIKNELESELNEQDLEQLKGGSADNQALSGEEEDEDVDRGTKHCCNTW